MNELGRDHDDGGAVVFCADFRNHLEPLQLQSRRVADHELCRFGELAGGFEFGFGFDDAGAALGGVSGMTKLYSQ